MRGPRPSFTMFPTLSPSRQALDAGCARGRTCLQTLCRAGLLNTGCQLLLESRAANALLPPDRPSGDQMPVTRALGSAVRLSPSPGPLPGRCLTRRQTATDRRPPSESFSLECPAGLGRRGVTTSLNFCPSPLTGQYAPLAAGKAPLFDAAWFIASLLLHVDTPTPPPQTAHEAITGPGTLTGLSLL